MDLPEQLSNLSLSNVIPKDRRKTFGLRNKVDWANLPEELLNLVVSNLLPNDRKTFGLVCRSWNALTNGSPWLMFYYGIEQSWRFVQSNDFVDMDFPEAEICCSKYGWLLMSRDDSTLFFLEPFNGTIIELPDVVCYYTTISFFHPPTSPQCFIFWMANHGGLKTLEIGILRWGEDKWTCFSCNNNIGFSSAICTPILRHGYVHCLDVNGNIGIVDVELSQLSWYVYTNCLSPPRLKGIIKQHFLFKIDGGETIFAVFVEHDERKVSVFRLLEPEMKWELVKDLGDKMLFVSQSTTFAETAPLKSMRNRIYFPIFWKDNKAAFYSLDSRNYHSFEDDYTNNNLYSFRELPFATWIRPMPTLNVRGQSPSWFKN